MKFAVLLPPASTRCADPGWIAGFAQHAEACGFESLVAIEHTVVIGGYRSTYPYDSSGKMELGDDCPIPDPLDLLAFLAGRTSRIGLATGVLVLPNHHPVVLAKRAATVDALSGGRLRLCVGMGWMAEEIQACGVDFDSRGRRADEQLEVLDKLWSAGPADHSGEFFAFEKAFSYPKPARADGIPLHFGGHSMAAARRAGRYGAGLQPLGVSGDRLHRLVDAMHAEAESCGRDPRRLELTLGHMVSRITPERAHALAELGADRVMLAPSPTSDLDVALAELTACAQRLELEP
ncbi:LLM class F420-dependent oxidoreductase [Nocardia sp. NPDC046763]|uniref:LLM class F420-dependent oxidoreductase n=1 Tax=Nocardia sp. NPDC046763 TaxID=3155256 RepID=UPI0033D7FA3A